MTKRILHIANLVGPGVIVPDVERSYVDVAPAYDFVDGGAINWPVSRRLNFVNGEVTIDGMEDTWDGVDLVWSFKIQFTDGRGKEGQSFSAFKTFPAGPSAAAVAYSDMIATDVVAPPEYGPTWAAQAEAAKDAAVVAQGDAESAKADAEAAAEAAAAVGASSDAQTANNVTAGPLTSAALSSTYVTFRDTDGNELPARHVIITVDPDTGEIEDIFSEAI